MRSAGKAVKKISFIPESQQYHIPADFIGSQVSLVNWLYLVLSALFCARRYCFILQRKPAMFVLA